MNIESLVGTLLWGVRYLMTQPERKWLYHTTPDWLREGDHVYFITLCCQQRGENTLAREPLARTLIDSIKDRQSHGLWYAHLVLIMPDHIHGLFSFPEDGRSMRSIFAKWKEWQARHHGILWQKGFFDRRLRSDESFELKADYIRNNPVRAGLVAEYRDWPYIYEAVADGP